MASAPTQLPRFCTNSKKLCGRWSLIAPLFFRRFGPIGSRHIRNEGAVGSQSRVSSSASFGGGLFSTLAGVKLAALRFTPSQRTRLIGRLLFLEIGRQELDDIVVSLHAVAVGQGIRRGFDTWCSALASDGPRSPKDDAGDALMQELTSAHHRPLALWMPMGTPAVAVAMRICTYALCLSVRSSKGAV